MVIGKIRVLMFAGIRRLLVEALLSVCKANTVASIGHFVG
jgi:hypothetical protein